MSESQESRDPQPSQRAGDPVLGITAGAIPDGSEIDAGATPDTPDLAPMSHEVGPDVVHSATRRELLGWGIAMALAVPPAALFSDLFPAQDWAAPIVAAGAYLLLSFFVPAALRQQGRVRPGRRNGGQSDGPVAVGGGLAFGILVVTLNTGERHWIAYPIGMVAILAVWWVVAVLATRQSH